ncbi:MAG: DUF2065 domain-containing protein [Gammaproteobacteria bacterium]|nr:DUF2065 domain-containing protein [Gammaproteobacteria bacterium]
MDWTAFFSALGLVFIIEGLLPFLSPSRAHKMYTEASRVPLKELRYIGFASMMVGLIVLFFVQ